MVTTFFFFFFGGLNWDLDIILVALLPLTDALLLGSCAARCLAVSPNFEIAKNNMAIALTDLGTKVISHLVVVY